MSTTPSFPEQIQQLQAEILAAIAGAAEAAALEAVRIQYLGSNGALPLLLGKMREVPKEERPIVGKVANEARTAIQAAFDARKESMQDAAAISNIDVTLPGRQEPFGSLHPLYQLRDRAVEIFHRLGFALADGPDVETEYYNFDALNTPPDHPARNEADTFYLKRPGADSTAATQPGAGINRLLLRSQTSPVQVRTMEKSQPPVRIIAPGRCFRRDEIDATHGMSFHQMEGLAVDTDISLAHLKGTLEFFFRELLGRDLEFRFRPHFFPFTEPSFEVDCRRPGTKIKGKEWLEICGCGMVDPNVLKGVGYDPEEVSGFAFGFGIERIAMVIHEIPDLRYFTENDVRFLRQFTPGLV